MLQTQSYTITTKPFSVSNHSFTTPIKSIPLRHAGPTFSISLPQFSVTCHHPQLFQQKPFPPPPQRPQPPSVYKGKAVLTVSPRAPEFTSMESGSFKISREGCMLLQFAPAVGVHQYDWNRKQVFSLSVNEMGSLISLGAKDSCEIFHDPFIGKGDEGKVRKVLKVEPLQDGSGHMFNLSVQNKIENINESIFIPVTKAELAVFNSLFHFIMPCLLGWNAFGSSIKPEVYTANPKHEDYEWNR
ncbi:single-stranded DNA-binding protein WHY1, chloroplastic-like isoform X2 [Cicer arietinum]|uniref:Single-stranded DNA-binding protein WHY1, chloroplastic-like isoform X2 n=1 Tax=Cicer arietinum TaxID=3827 RepID=A0A1S2XKF3_CICAR|nr:single-stranded DNA-binding protein WHY1, chloroplastic-like isoform X2 [Cicer arietinum]